MTLALSGIGIRSGVAAGKAHLLSSTELEIEEYDIPEQGVEAEIERFRAALRATRSHLRELARQLRETAGSAPEDIIRTHLHMLDDAFLTQDTEQRIANHLCNAEWALQLQLDQLINEFKILDDEYIQSRQEDVIQVVRLLQSTLSREDGAPAGGMPRSLADNIVVAASIAPDELALLHRAEVRGVILEHGSPYAHASILARSLRIPMVVGVNQALRLIREDEAVILDGHYGTVFATEDPGLTRHYQNKQQSLAQLRSRLDEVRGKPCITCDEVPVSLLANGEDRDDLAHAVNDGAEGVGLYRTEFLFLSGEPPDEERQYQHYREALQALDGRTLTIRTLDLGADKSIDLIRQLDLLAGPNPALGLRGIRLCLCYPELFKPQLRAILRVAAEGPVQLLIPMLTDPGEVQAVHRLLGECRLELQEQGLPAAERLPVGGMVEIPAAALLIDQLAEALDFIAIGSNDLVQYLLAVDRADEQVSQLYNPLHPAMLALMERTIRGADAAGIPVTLCGEMAADPRYTRLLLGLGLRRFSVNPASLLEIRQQVRDADCNGCTRLVQDWCQGGYRTPPSELLSAINT